MNNKNLVPFGELPPERRKELARMGGIASGEARRRKAYMKAVAREMILRTVYFREMEAELETEWRAFQAWRRRKARAQKKQQTKSG